MISASPLTGAATMPKSASSNPPEFFRLHVRLRGFAAARLRDTRFE
jgi:hypothetical protein